MKLLTGFIVIAAASTLSACGYDDYHFHAAGDGQINLRMGPVNRNCSLSAASEQSFPDGSKASFTNQMQGDTCVIKTQWSGPIMDTSSFRHEGAKELHGDATIDDTQITRFNLKMESVRLRDLAHDFDGDGQFDVLDVADTAIDNMDAKINIGGEEALGVHFDTTEFGTDPDHPNIFVATPTALVPQAEKAWKAKDDVVATGSSTLVFKQAALDNIEAADEPALSLEYQLDLTGNKPGSESDFGPTGGGY